MCLRVSKTAMATRVGPGLHSQPLASKVEDQSHISGASATLADRNKVASPKIRKGLPHHTQSAVGAMDDVGGNRGSLAAESEAGAVAGQRT
jgi:hypothetical protein